MSDPINREELGAFVCGFFTGLIIGSLLVFWAIAWMSGQFS